MAAQLVTGIGFLGAGAIIRQGVSVRGLTTAAGVWVVAAIGMAAGAGYYSAALIATGSSSSGWGRSAGSRAGALLRRLRRGGRLLEVDLRAGEPIGPVLAVLEARRARVFRIEFKEEEDRRRQLRLDLDLPIGAASDEVVEEIAGLAEVATVRWTG